MQSILSQINLTSLNLWPKQQKLQIVFIFACQNEEYTKLSIECMQQIVDNYLDSDMGDVLQCVVQDGKNTKQLFPFIHKPWFKRTEQ